MGRDVSALSCVQAMLIACAVAQASDVTGAGGVRDRFVNSVGIEMQYVPGGTFLMGSGQLWPGPKGDVLLFGHVHPVELDAFYVGRAEVSVRQFRLFAKATGLADSEFLPICNLSSAELEETALVGVTWAQADAYCRWLSARESREYRLPTEAEFEYVCRAGEGSSHWWGPKWDERRAASRLEIGSDDALAGLPRPFGFFPRNGWGLFDVIGNAEEWTKDWYDANALPPYPRELQRNPTGPASGRAKVTRGGSFVSTSWGCNCVFRGFDVGQAVGFRVVASVRPDDYVSAPVEAVEDLDAVSLEAPWDLDNREVLLPGHVPMKFVYVPEGEAVVGSPAAECPGYRVRNEGPQAPLRVTSGFWMSVTEVTQRQYCALMEGRPGTFIGEELPAHGPAMLEMNEFIAALNKALSLNGQIGSHEVVRCPSEYEWEYACRANSTSAYSYGDDANELARYAWVDVAGGPREVAQKAPNRWGLYDMHGNVWERVGFWAGEYDGNPIVHTPLGILQGRVGFAGCRGGAWAYPAHRCRSAARQYGMSFDYWGMRLVIVQAGPPRRRRPA